LTFQVLALSRHSYVQLIQLYPEQHETILSNVISKYGVGRQGELTDSILLDSLPEEDQVTIREHSVNIQ
jgi:hypothetical protein